MNKLPTYKTVSSEMTLEEKIGQLFMPAAFINDSEAEICRLERLIAEYTIGAICFFHSRASAATNFEGKKKVVHNDKSFTVLKQLIARYQKAAKVPLLIAIDAEWGLAMRVENTPQYPYAITLGAIQNDAHLIFQVGKNIANDCKAAGIHWNLAPVVDINNNPKNPVIGYRSFGEDKFQVTEKALAFIKGTQSEGILTSIKHFPGHGDTATDSHLGLPLINKSKKELLENELYPFQELIKQEVDSVMIGHLSVPALANGHTTSSSISKSIITGLLRNEMGFDGVVISDALNMHAVSTAHPTKGVLEWLAFNAGNDVLCFAENVKEGIDMILEKATSKEIEQRFLRVWKLKEKAIANPQNKSGSLAKASRLNKIIAKKSLSLVQGTEQTIAAFSENPFIGISNTKASDNLFFKTIRQNKKFAAFSLSNIVSKDLTEEIKGHRNILLALFLPQVKPTGHFGFSENELALINKLIETKNVLLYLFGNPYVLNHITVNKTVGIVIAYQNFIEFQENAANHFLGHTTALGLLPITTGHSL